MSTSSHALHWGYFRGWGAVEGGGFQRGHWPAMWSHHCSHLRSAVSSHLEVPRFRVRTNYVSRSFVVNGQNTCMCVQIIPRYGIK